MRIVRKLLMIILSNSGWSFFHSACVNFCDKGILLMGPKNSGKTSLLIHLIETLQANYVSNDIIALKGNMKEIMLISFPVSLGIRTDYYNTSKYITDIQLYDNTRQYIHCKDFINEMNCKISVQCKLGDIFIPQYVNDNIFKVEKLLYSEKKDFLCEQEINIDELSPMFKFINIFMKKKQTNNIYELLIKKRIYKIYFNEKSKYCVNKFIEGEY